MSADDITYVQQEALYSEAVEQATVFVRTFLAENYPELDVDPTRVLNDVLVAPSAMITAYNNINMDRARRGMSLYEITKDPTLADDEQVDRILSNWGVERTTGTAAEGNVLLVLTTDSTISINSGERFTTNGLTYLASSAVTGTSGALINLEDRKIVARRDGTYTLSVPVVATDTGSTYLLRKGQQITWETPASTYINSYAESDFTGGTDTQTNEELISELNLGITTPVMAGRQNIYSLIREFYPQIEAVSTIGYGDAEMLRDSHNLFAIKTGGKADIYTKTRVKPETKTFDIECTLLDRYNKIFQLHIIKDIYPGFYFISSIVPTDVDSYLGSLEILQDVRGIDTSDMPYPIPDMEGTIESAYTRFQTAIVQFTDPEADLTDVVVGDKLIYRVGILGMPDVDTIQDYISGRDRRPVQGDYLVKAPVPISVAVSVEIQYVLGDKEVDVDAAKTAIVNAVNDIKFNRPTLSASTIVDVVQDTLEDRATISPTVSMVGNIRYPSGATDLFRSSTQLTIPASAEESTSSRTAIFYTDYSLVDITLKQMEILSV